MKQVIKKIGATFLAIVVLFSTMSFTINQHYCGEVLVDSSIFSKADSCGMEMEKPSPSEDCEVKKKNCCTEVLKIIEGQQDLKTQISKLDFGQQVYVAAFLYSYVTLFEEHSIEFTPFNTYVPPLIIKDIQVLDEVFII